jgi:phosphopantetheine adenylyltransferase
MAKFDLHSLLLLPPSPSPASAASLSAAYRPALTDALTTLSKLRLPHTTVLEIALPINKSSLSFKAVESILARLYSLVCVVCAKHSIEMYGPGSVDARIVLLSSLRNGDSLSESDLGQLTTFGGPIVDLPTLALTRQQWRTIFSVDGEEGQEYFARYLKIVNSTNSQHVGEHRIVAGGIGMVLATATQPNNSTSDNVLGSHSSVAVGGTFDHLHAGHKLLLTATALALYAAAPARQRRLVVGITGDELLKNKKYAEYLGSWEQRASDVVDFLKTILSFARPQHQDQEAITKQFNEPVVNGHAIYTTLRSCAITIECVEIQDPFGPTITDENITALVVSGETRSGGQAVNSKREEKGWAPLEVFEVDVLDATEEGAENPSKVEDFTSKISSTAIRKHKAELKTSSSL